MSEYGDRRLNSDPADLSLEEIAEAHRCMEENRASGKMIVRPSHGSDRTRTRAQVGLLRH